MRLEPPGWWYGTARSDRLKAALLQPLAVVYDAAVRTRFARAQPYHSQLPVICIGNFTMGGAGKTPLALAVAAMLKEIGHRPVFLTRGYGGRLAGPYQVDAACDEAGDVGDEALLLARAAPTIVARDRGEGAKAIERMSASVIVMDDGFQNPSLVKDLALIAVDSGAVFGNGKVFPAGPLRASFDFQMARADALVMIGSNGKTCGLDGKPRTFRANIVPDGDVGWLRAQPVIAFSGIGRPAKFFDTLDELGAAPVEFRAFPDHHMFTEDEAQALINAADRAGAQLVMTEKDWLRLPAISGPLLSLKQRARALPVSLVFANEDHASLKEILRSVSKFKEN